MGVDDDEDAGTPVTFTRIFANLKAWMMQPDAFGQHGVNVYDEIPTRFKFPAFFPQPGEPTIRPNKDFEYAATYFIDGFILVPLGDRIRTRDTLDSIIAVNGPFKRWLERPGVLGDLDGELTVTLIGNYGDLELGSKPDALYGARMIIEVDI